MNRRYLTFAACFFFCIAPYATTQTTTLQPGAHSQATLTAAQETSALRVLLTTVKTHIESAAEAMPADKYAFAPGEGEF